MGMLCLGDVSWRVRKGAQENGPYAQPHSCQLLSAMQNGPKHICFSSLDAVVSLNKNTASNNPKNMLNPRSKLIFHLWSG